VLFHLTLDVPENGEKASKTNILIPSLMFIEQLDTIDARTAFRNMYNCAKASKKILYLSHTYC